MSTTAEDKVAVVEDKVAEDVKMDESKSQTQTQTQTQTAGGDEDEMRAVRQGMS